MLSHTSYMSKNTNTINKGGKAKDKLIQKSTEDPKSDVNNLSINDIFKFMDLFFDRYGIIFTHLYNSFNKFLEEDVKTFLETGDHTFFERVTKEKLIKYKFKYDNISFRGPTLENDVEPMFPTDARNRNLTYGGKLMAKVSQLQEITDIATGEIITRVLGHPEDNVPVANIPVMLRSKMCSLNTHKGYDKRECEFDLGGYFVVNGSEKVIISQDRMVENKPLAFIKKDSGMEIYTVQVNSRSYRPHGITQILNIRMKKDGNITIKVPILNEVPVFILFRALGIESDRDIITMVVADEKDIDMITAMETSLDYSRNEKGDKIQTQQDAVDFLVNKLRVIKKYTETDKNVRNQQRKIHLMDLLKNNFLPHVEGDLRMKAYYLGIMVNKLLKCYLDRIVPDDRDSYLNKRIDLPGDLLFELFRQFYRKMLNECNKFFKKRNSSDEEPLVIINQIKPNIIEQGIKASLLTGAWPRRKGVAQMLQRYSFLQAVAFLRRIDAPGGDASTSKITGPRHLHPSTACLACCLTGDTEILMGDGSKKRIDTIKNGDIIMSTNKNNLKDISTKIKNYFSRMPKKILEIITESGNKLKCTYDHPILVRTSKQFNMMTNAGSLAKGVYVVLRDNNGKFFSSKIKLIKELPAEITYDFETCADTHTIIANGFVTSNCVSTPEHAKVGLTKHLALIASITVLQTNQINILKSYFKKKLTDIRDVPSHKIKDMTIVSLNGEPLGLTNKAVQLEAELRLNKLNGTFEPTTSIVHDIPEREIRVYCDGGRMFTPFIRVNDNKAKLTKELINSTSLNKSQKDTKITSWDEFMMKHNDVVENLDMEELPYFMVADSMMTVERERKKMVESIDKVKDVKSNKVDNRYDDMTYVKYSHCVFHPSFLLAEIPTNIPFCNHNAGPRNIFQYSQQAVVAIKVAASRLYGRRYFQNAGTFLEFLLPSQ
jgi:DNA-directed RNA polymerase beta subunit